MASRKLYRVQYVNSAWAVRHEGVSLSIYVRKEEAVSAGQKVAKANAPSQLVVHRMDGTIEYEYTYGNDPFPPRG